MRNRKYKISVIDTDRVDIRPLVPACFQSLIGCEDELAVGAVNDEGELLCLALINVSEYNKRLAFLDYIYTPRGHRGKKAASQLVDEVCLILEEAGMMALCLKLISRSGLTGDIFSFAREQSFYPVTFYGRIMQFSRNAIIRSSYFQKINALKSYMSGMISLGKYMESETGINLADDIRTEIFRCDRYVENGFFDPDVSKVYVNDGIISGAVSSQKLSDNLMYMVFSILSGRAEAKYVLPAMMGTMVSDMRGKWPDRDQNLLVQSVKASSTHSFKTLFGDPEESVRMCEFVRIFNTAPEQAERAEKLPEVIREKLGVTSEFTGSFNTDTKDFEDIDRLFYDSELQKLLMSSPCYRILSPEAVMRSEIMHRMNHGLPLTDKLENAYKSFREESDSFFEETVDYKYPLEKPFLPCTAPVRYDRTDHRRLERYINRKSSIWEDSRIESHILQDLVYSKLLNYVVRHQLELPSVTRLDDSNDAALRSFMRETSPEERGFDRFSLDLSFSRFYIENGKILVCASVERMSEFEFILRDYCSKSNKSDKENRRILAALFYSALNNIVITVGPWAKVLVVCSMKRGEKTYEIFLGKGYEHFLVTGDISPEGIKLARVSRDSTDAHYNEDIDEEVLENAGLEQLSRLALVYDDPAAETFHEITVMLSDYLENGDGDSERLLNLREACESFYIIHRGRFYSCAGRNRKNIVRRLTELLENAEE